MEAVWVSKRIEQWQLLQETVKRSDTELAHMMGMLRSRVQNWRYRLQDASGDDMASFLSRSRCRKTSPKKVTEAVEARILFLWSVQGDRSR